LPHVLCANAENTGRDLQNFDFEIFGKFLKFKIWPTAAELSEPIGLL